MFALCLIIWSLTDQRQSPSRTHLQLKKKKRKTLGLCILLHAGRENEIRGSTEYLSKGDLGKKSHQVGAILGNSKKVIGK